MSCYLLSVCRLIAIILRMENNAVRVRVPATSANLGPGFDALGVALQLYSYVDVELAQNEENDITLEGKHVVHEEMSAKDNIIWEAVQSLTEHLQITLPPLHITLKNDIPLSRGLGSSAAVRVGVITAVNLWLQRNNQAYVDQRKILYLATQLEGHPDNAAPALFGGFIASVVEEEKVLFTQLAAPCYPTLLVFVPDTELSTNKARQVLPQSISRKDAVFNLSRVGLLTAVLSNGHWREEPDLLKAALQDRLHQVYRAGLMPAYDKVAAAAVEAGALGATLSGAGPSMLIWLPCAAKSTFIEEVDKAVLKAAEKEGVLGRIFALEIDQEGCVEITD